MIEQGTRTWQRLAQRSRYIDAHRLLQLIEAGLTWLRTNQETVNALNVYPIPDGDTGTNMVLTMEAACKEVGSAGGGSIGKALQALAHGAQMGARGNSGVILSQLWRGFARALDGVDEMDAPAFAAGLAAARDTAYRGVGQPVEGTILTVSKEVAAAAEQAIQDGATSNLDILERVVRAADAAVENTPNLLEVLAKAGVVDAGGKGLFFILEGMLRSATGLDLDVPLFTIDVDPHLMERVEGAIEGGQDWEVVVDFRPNTDFELRSFTAGLADMGTSIQIAEGDGLMRMHIHVPDQSEYEPIEYCKKSGTITDVHIENLMDQLLQIEQHTDSELQLAEVSQGQVAVVAVASGIGLAKVLAEMGAGAIIEGGQTMNPSAEELLTAIEDLPTDQIIVLPNNKNVIMAAEQAAKLSNKQVLVVPTRSMPQGIAAMFCLDADRSLKETADSMNSALGEIKTAELTRATRSTTINGIPCMKGQIIALLDDNLIAATEDLFEAALLALKEAEADTYELITLYWGADLTEREAQKVSQTISERYPEQEIELVHGGQPHYDLIFSIE
ncbi:MAG: DAK2 domain-containing protein [Anaerolineae bacterium]|nr:MAG: DAK2 domain-containing protein [Anaerolineae bacterium]